MKGIVQKVRVAPMKNEHEELKVFPQPKSPIKGEENEIDIKTNEEPGKEHDVDIKECKRKWNLLKGTLRFKANVKMAYEAMNKSILKEKKKHYDKLENQQNHCLLKSPLKGNPKDTSPTRSNSKKQSLLTKTDGHELINYFIELSQQDVELKVVDYGYLELLIERGAKVNAVDNYGQTVLHEVARIWHRDVANFIIEKGLDLTRRAIVGNNDNYLARIWHKDVANFIIEKGANVNHQDSYGRSPLHVAAAADYSEMVELLLDCGADINSRTLREIQTPIHYAASHDAVNSLATLLARGSDLNDQDYKGRTPLLLAAELDRSLTAGFLINKGAPAGVYDDTKMGALVMMIEKMPLVALNALEQFHEKHRASRTQFFYLNYLMPPYRTKQCAAKSPLQAAVESNNCSLLLHPVFQQLIDVKWKQIARYGAWFYASGNFLVSLLWTIRLCNLPSNPKNIFRGGIAVFGVFLDILNTLTLVIMILAEFRQYIRAQKSNQNYVEWRRRELDRDLEFAHPQWPEEREYIERERRELEESDSSYIRDKWNHFDWLTYFMMTSTIVALGCSMHYKTTLSHNLVRGIGSVTLIFLWVRLLNFARPFAQLGLFVVMLGHVVEDTLKLLFLSLHFCIPYMAAFWMNFGVDNVEGYTLNYLEILYNLFQMIVVGDYNFEGIVVHSQIMSRLLCGTFIFFVGIICLNLFIALMSDTFQRVYDNAKATAVMQRAKFLHEVEITISSSRLKRHREWISEHCAPLILYYDDDTVDSETTTIKKMTHQIKDDMDEMKTIFQEKFVTSDNETTGLKDELHELKESMRNFQAEHLKSVVQTRAEITGLSLMLKELIEKQKECNLCTSREKEIKEQPVKLPPPPTPPPAAARRRKKSKREMPLKSILKPDSSKLQKQVSQKKESNDNDEVFVVSTSSDIYQHPPLLSEQGSDTEYKFPSFSDDSNIQGTNTEIVISAQNDEDRNDNENV